MEPLRKCKDCGLEAHTEEDLEGFTKHKPSTHGRRHWCSPCYNKARNQGDYRLNTHLRTKFGITLDDYNRILEEQDGRCSICDTTACSTGQRLSVDHCHDTGAVRGLLCRRCNAGCGQFNDSPDLLRKGADYLEAGNDHRTN
jgi:hypothetical protein